MTSTAVTQSVEGLGQLLGGGASAPAEAKFVCPFCGSVNETAEGPCPRCTMENTAAGRKATKARIGPWYVLQRRNPAAPGMRFETLLSFVRKGRIKPHSVVRGPTTHQLWRFASQVKGVSREFGLCYSCGGGISPQAQVCPQCNRLQEPPPAPDAFLELAVGESAQPAKAAVAAPISTPIFREIPASAAAPRTDVVTGADTRATSAPTSALSSAPAPIATDSIQQEESAEISASRSAEAHAQAEPHAFSGLDLIIPAMDPHAPPNPHPEDEAEQEMVIPVLAPASLTQPLAIAPRTRNAPSDAIQADRVPAGRTRRSDAGFYPPGGGADPGARRQAVGGGSDDEPPLRPRGPDPDDDQGDEVHDPVPVLGSAAPRPMPATAGAHGRPMMEVVLFIFIIVGAIVSGLLYVDPELRQQTFGWLMRQSWMSGSSNDGNASSASEARQRPVLAPMAATAPRHPDAPADVRSGSSGVTPPPLLAVPKLDVPAPAPSTSSSGASNAPPPRPSPPPPDSAPADTSSSGAQVADDAAYNRARTLRNSAIDADGAQQYKKAVELFEQIKQLPRETWPGDLEMRLKRAREQSAKTGQ